MSAERFPKPSPAEWAALTALLLAGVGLRFLYWALPELDADMALWGVQAMDILHGRWHLFFSGELWGGSLEAWLAAPLFALFGPGPRVLCLVPAALSLLMVLLAWRLGRRELGPAGGLWAAAWCALPPLYLLVHGVAPRGAYIEVPVLTVLSLMLTLPLARGQSRRLGLAAFGLGLVWGLGLWTHLLMAPVAAACGLWLLLHRPLWTLRREVWPLAAGLALGGLPLWALALPAGLASGEELPQVSAPLLKALAALAGHGLPKLMGLPDALAASPLALAWGLTLLGLYLLLTLAALRPGAPAAVRGPRDNDLAWLCLWLLLALAGAWLWQGTFAMHTWRHILPMAAPIAFLFAAGAMRLGPGRAGALLAGLLICLNLWGDIAVAPMLDAGRRRAWGQEREQEARLFSLLRSRGENHVYGEGFWQTVPLTLYSGGAVTFADQVENHMPRLLRLADASPRPAYVITWRAEDFALNLERLGLCYRRSKVGRFTVFDDFAGPAWREEAVPPRGWRVAGVRMDPAWDRDLATRWTSGQPQRPGQSVVLDLGRRVEGLCRLVLLSARFLDAPAGLKLATSEDGRHWLAAGGQTSLFAPMFWSLDRPLIRRAPSRCELRFSPRPARLLRITQAGRRARSWWSISEILLYRRTGDASPGPSPASLAKALAALPAGGAVYAPPEVTALLPPARDGAPPPQRPRAGRDYLGRLDLALTPDSALLLPSADWPASAAALAGRLGAAPSPRRLGQWTLVRGLRPAAPVGAPAPLPAGTRADARPNQALAHLAVDGLASTRWPSGGPQRPGMRFSLLWPEPMTLSGLVLDCGPWAGDTPRSLALELSPDGATWRPLTPRLLLNGEAAWWGSGVMARGGRTLLGFEPVAARGLRLIETGATERRWWSLAQVRLLVPRRP